LCIENVHYSTSLMLKKLNRAVNDFAKSEALKTVGMKKKKPDFNKKESVIN